MSKTSKDLSTFLTAIDTISDKLEAPRRSQDNKVPDCTLKELAALHAVSKYGCINMSKLATTIAVPISTATRIVDQLIAKDLLIRQASIKDARKVEIDFSPLGHEINAYIDETRQAYALSMLSILPEADRATFLNQLSLLLTAPR